VRKTKKNQKSKVKSQKSKVRAVRLRRAFVKPRCARPSRAVDVAQREFSAGRPDSRAASVASAVLAAPSAAQEKSGAAARRELLPFAICHLPFDLFLVVG
jgi:hypothetical protein